MAGILGVTKVRHRHVCQSKAIDGANQYMGPCLSCLIALKGGWRERRERRAGVLLATRRRFNGVFQFAVAGNERRLKPGQLFCLRRD